jgi:hypothetical protein
MRASGQDPAVSQHSQMPGHCPLITSCDLCEFAYPFGTIVQMMDEFQAQRVAQSPAKFGLKFVYRQRAHFPPFLPGQPAKTRSSLSCPLLSLSSKHQTAIPYLPNISWTKRSILTEPPA